MDVPDAGGGSATAAAPLSTPDLRLFVNRLHSCSLVIKSHIHSCILSHLPAFSAAAHYISFTDAITADINALLGLLSPGPTASTLPFSAPPPHLLNSLACNALPAHALSLYLLLAAPGDPFLHPDNFTYAFAVSATHPRCQSFQGDAFIGSALVGFHVNFLEVGNAMKVFDGMFKWDTVAWNAFISGV